MTSFVYTITEEAGMHARPAGLLVQEAKKYSSAVKMAKGDKTGDVKRLFQIMGMEIKKGDQVTVTCDGPDEVKAAAALESFCKENL